ncbi:Receptor-type guanylate cyclase gcy [Seminavis robusta]|uniref:Receptor-type guanylate cyclase gcy n=1 Tax=Seminavis robusta TaxID=568900 RepID=A0A9N8EVL2_9STRA|nr:Receptor-type guanylate cyclase gcy [Seminavis robusta]|eukprot:Sro2373_g325290.1 Receptor-type guanylate cyclase gcy (1146) ;mRNA; f:8715-13321
MGAAASTMGSATSKGGTRKSDAAKAWEDENHDDEHTMESAESNGSVDDSIQRHSLDIEKTTKRTTWAALLVVIVGAVASASFLYMGISNEKETKDESFQKRSTDLAEGVQGAMNDYENACSWIHQACKHWREYDFAYKDFRDLHDSIAAYGGGLDFYAMEWCPNVTAEERPAVEERAAAFFRDKPYEGVPDFNYTGIRGLLPEDPASMTIVSREEKPFYFPIQFFEPIETVKGLYHYDVYSAPWEQPSVNLALETWKPVATPGFKIVASGEQESFTTVLYHPGVPVEGTKPKDLSNMLIQIKALLERSVRFQTESLGVYLFDRSEDMMFLGGMHVVVDANGDRELEYFPDRITLDEITGKDRLYEEDIEFASRVWTIYVVPIDDAYEPSLVTIIVTGVLIFSASLGLALWMLTNMYRSIQIHRVMSKAAAEAAIVTSLFPENVRDRLIQDATRAKPRGGKKGSDSDIFKFDGNDSRGVLCQDGLSNLLTSEGLFGCKPIADFHPYTTIMFADLVGFTAWSSVREPSQVFTLLEVVYHCFDNIAKRRRVYKVETVGDCYVAVSGLPQPRKDHAVVMSRFANDCLMRLPMLLKALETTLGPDTGDLGIRIGLHSGQVTAGVLRGDKGRFQLFGDTMNTASRMESTGIRNKIQCSSETADLLREGGRERWITPREDAISVRGKGLMQTYILKVTAGSRSSAQEAAASLSTNDTSVSSDREGRIQRLVNWNVEVLSSLLKKVVARREAMGNSRRGAARTVGNDQLTKQGGTVLDEVLEIIPLPEFNGDAIRRQVDPDSIVLDSKVVEELSLFVKEVAMGYRNNPFHSFDHASHVTMSVLKMMSRIENPKEILLKKKEAANFKEMEAKLHDTSFGITSDPLSLFSCAFSALIHDMDHQGVPNMTLVNEKSPIAQKYENKSVAEQNSVELAWEKLLSPRFQNLMGCICCNEEEFRRFRQLVVNSVMATDIVDKQLGAARKARWNKAFIGEEDPSEGEDDLQAVNRKATIVIEHLIQASDVSHTMQHWHIYMKWNERLFQEMYKAYKAGRLEKDPSEGWYRGELGFFDFYIIPLAKKLFTCGVFGVSSDEFLNYAIINRKEWELKGEEMVKQYQQNYKVLYEECEESEYAEVTERADDLDDPTPVFSSILEC